VLKPESEEGYEVARAILNYLYEHPDAKDTLEGIAQWWLTREGIERELEEVERGVSILLDQGLVVEVRRGGLMPYYQLNRAREDDSRQESLN
jgi:predicted transcriptional regulator with HTH domain